MYEPVSKRFEEVMITFMLPEASQRALALSIGAAATLALTAVLAVVAAPDAPGAKSSSVSKLAPPADKQPPPSQDTTTRVKGQKEPAEAPKQATNVKSGKAAVTKATTTKRRVATERLVPPPPPSIPGVLATPHMVPGFEVIEFVSHDELIELCQRTTTDWERASKKLEQTKKQSEEKKKRAHSFETLYSEGVVSRRELESAQHEASSMDDDVSEQEQRVTDLDIKLKRINSKLKTFPAKKKTETAKKIDPLTK